VAQRNNSDRFARARGFISNGGVEKYYRIAALRSAGTNAGDPSTHRFN
jgi:hypothetical protein